MVFCCNRFALWGWLGCFNSFPALPDRGVAMLKSVNANLRSKILVALVALSVVPLFVILLILSGVMARQFEKGMQASLRAMSAFAERSAAGSQQDLLNYVKMTGRNNDMVNAVFYSSLTGDTSQLDMVIQQSQEVFRFDLVEVLNKDGEVIFRFLPGSQTIEQSTGKDHPVIQASLAGKGGGDISVFDGQLSLVAASPVQLQQETIGHLVGVVFLDDQFATKIKEESGAEIGFFSDGKVVAASHSELKEVSAAEVEAGDETSTRIDGKSYALSVASLGGQGRGVLLALDRSELLTAQRGLQATLFVLLAVVAVVAVAVGLAISRNIVRPLGQVVGNLREIAEGEADLTRELEVSSRDEVGELASNFNRFVARLREMVERTRSVSGGLNEAVEKIRGSAREVNEGAVRQSQSLEESYRAMQGIEESVSGIAESTGTLVDSAEESSSATLELGATIEEIASQMEKLFAVVDEVSSSINEMSVASQQVTENVEILSSSTEVTASSITELDASIKEIEENAERTNRLSEEAARDAQQGKETVDETIRGIGAIREMVDRASAAIQELGRQSSAIGKILTVIDDVADQTSLLALNAAIIAAQAGEHGKGFAVVADEIRELAERTAVSTREIASIIGSLQSGTEEAVRAMAAGSERVHQEVERSKAAGAALEKIRSSTLKSTEQVGGIVRATQEQARGSRQITNSINQVASMLGQIATAIKQQTDGARQLARAAESMKEIASQVKHSTGEQAKGSRQINASMERIRTMIERIDGATREQTQRSRQVLEAVSSIRVISESTASRTAELDQVVETLTRQTSTLEDEVGAFKV
jgi:methyl-accepting chemotaxis protein